MPFVTFIYKVGNNKTIYYGKYCTDYISDDHEGLDEEVRYPLIMAINSYRQKNNIPKIHNHVHIGILSFSSNEVIPTYSTMKEISCFHFYHDYDKNIYMNGKKI